MIFTLYYMYATFIQWWRLGSLKNKLNGTMNSKNALLVCDQSVIYDTKKSRSFETLLFKSDDRIGCTVVPKQKINLSQWASFPRDCRCFPILFKNSTLKISSPSIFILIETMLDTYLKHSADILQVENFGELVAWRTSENFEAILKTDLDKLTKLVHCFSQGNIDINHELKLLKIETIEVEGTPTKLKYDRKYSYESMLKYSHAPVHWKRFVENMRDLYSKMKDCTTPKITIENGKSDDMKKVPVNEVKPIKKEDKNTLEVNIGNYRRHKSSDHKRDKHVKNDVVGKLEIRGKEEHKRVKEESKKETKDLGGEGDVMDDSNCIKVKAGSTKGERDEARSCRSRSNEKSKKEDCEGYRKDVKRETKEQRKDEEGLNYETKRSKDRTKPTKTKIEKEANKDHARSQSKEKSSKSSKENPKTDPENANRAKTMSIRTGSADKKLVKSIAVCDDETDIDKVPEERKSTNAIAKEQLTSTKPPNILIYADSFIAKDNVKTALLSMLNRDKYTIYDLPTEANQTMWGSSTVLVVVCGSVPSHLTTQLLQYLLNGGQLLCLCSDLLYSVLHTFTTAEVREHELVRFTYGKWKQVKMMHHIFCYQASPTKKQFSKDSDTSNTSNSSSPIAPRTPSAVEIQHNSRSYVVQVQVLGTEETWQTPSLLLATVKGGQGRAVFSQVHLEINPNQYEEDENKFAALKDSDKARLEILRDILSNRLDIDCCVASVQDYSPGYFLGRHDMKLQLLNTCSSIKDNYLSCSEVALKFCGKDEVPTTAAGVDFMPVFIHSCPSNFSTVTYFGTLETEHIGRLVIYADVMASSQRVLSHALTHGLVVIARQQTNGVGRLNNVWISPLGSALFSMQLHVPLDSPLGRVLPFVQQLVMVGVVSAIKTSRGCQDLDIGIKWPNDLYANGAVKIGGVLSNSTTLGDKAIVNVGCGINLDNANPTVCVNNLIRQSNNDRATAMKTISYETFFATVFNEIERIYKIAQNGDIDYVYDLYYKYWLHNDSEITVAMKNGLSEQVRIVGIDDFGFLRVRTSTGSISVVHPDGNSFDMLRGLVSPKLF